MAAPFSIPRIHWPDAARSVPVMIAVSAILAMLTAPVFPMIYGPNIDDSLHWAYNYFADGHYSLAEQISFPHGPLAFLLHPVAIGNNFIVALWVNLLAAACLAFVVLYTGRARGHLYPATAACALLLLLSVCDLQLLLIGLVASLLTLHRLVHRPLLVILYMIPAVLAILVKAYAGLICGLLVATEIIYRIGRGHYKAAGQNFVVYLLFFVAGWLLLFGDIAHAGDFFLSQLQLALDNSEAVQFYNASINWWLIGAMICALIYMYGLIDEPLGKQYYLLMMLPLFAAWKHGMGRSEVFHMAGFFHFLLLFVILLWLLSPQRRSRVIVVSALAPAAFGIQLFVYEDYVSASNMHLLKLRELSEAVFDYDSLQHRKQLEIRHATRDQHLPETVKALIGDSAVDVYPWNYSLIPTNGLNWRPRPVLNSYAAYTPWLDRRDSAWFTSQNAPHFVLWHFTDPNERGHQLESIDNRYLLNDQPLTLPALFAGYERRVNSDRLMVFEKRTRPLRIDRKKVDLPVISGFGLWSDVPVSGADALLRVRIYMNKNIRGALKSLLYKGEIFHVFYELSDGRILSHRIVPKNAEHGLWLSPLMLRPSVSRGTRVSKVMVQCNDPSNMKDEIRLEFERFIFSEGETVPDICSFFSDRCIDSTAITFLNTGTADYVQDARFYLEKQTKISTVDHLSPPASYALEAGDTSGIFVLPLDSLRRFSNRRWRVITTANVRTAEGSDASFVLASGPDPDEKSVLYMKRLAEILRGTGEWTHCSAYYDLTEYDLATYPRLYFSVVNPIGSPRAWLDDLSVLIVPLE